MSTPSDAAASLVAPGSRASGRPSPAAGRSPRPGPHLPPARLSHARGHSQASVSHAGGAGPAPSASDELRGIVERNQTHRRLVRDTVAAVEQMATENAMMEEILAEKHVMVTNVDLALIVQNAMTNPDGSTNSAILASRKPPARQMLSRVRLSGSSLPSAAAVAAGSPAVKAFPAISTAAAGSGALVPAPHPSAHTAAAPLPTRGLGTRCPGGATAGAAPRADAFDGVGGISTGKVNFGVLLEEQASMRAKVADSRVAYDRMIKNFVSKQQSLHDRFAGIV